MTAQQEDCEAAGRGWACDRVNASDCLDRRVERLQPLRKRTIRDQRIGSAAFSLRPDVRSNSGVSGSTRTRSGRSRQ